MLIADICHRSAFTAQPDTELVMAAQLMRAHHVGFLVVVQPDEESGVSSVVGVLTDRDIVVSVLARGLDPRAVSVGDIMVRHPVTVTQTEQLTQAIDKMRKIGVRRLPVLGEHGRLIGVIALDDILVALASAFGELSKALGRGIVTETMQRPA